VKKFILFVFLCAMVPVLAVGVLVGKPIACWIVKREVAAFLPHPRPKEGRAEPVRAETKASPEVKLAVTTERKNERKTVNREILENAERLSRTLENCKKTVKPNSATR
jgi:hypothetical protein